MDWNNDGKKDLVVGLYSVQSIHIYKNNGTDASPVLAKDYLRIVYDTGVFPFRGTSVSSPYVVDWNNDGKKDVIVGEKNGRVWRLINSGTDANPVFAYDADSEIQSGGEDIDVGDLSTPVVLDWDLDGKKDLLVGAKDGKVRFFRNTGTDSNPEFNGFELLKANGTILDVGTMEGGMNAVDWDNDGFVDLQIPSTDGTVYNFRQIPQFSVPTGLAAVGGNDLVSLDWNAGGDNVATYNVYRSMTSDGTYSAIQTGIGTNAYVDHAVTNYTTYYYKVSAVGTNTLESAKSDFVAATPFDPGNQAPAFSGSTILETDAMEGVAYSATLADHASDPESDPMTFLKELGPDWLDVASNGMLSGTPAASDIGTNSFTVQVSAAGGSDTAELRIIVEGVPDTTAPAAPAGLTAIAGNNSVSLSWTANSEEDLAGYSVYRSTISGDYTNDALTNGLAGTNYVDTTALNSNTYYYVVSASDTSDNESAQSSQVSATPTAATQISIHSYSSAQNENVPENLLDGDTDENSRWSANSFPQWTIFDLGASQNLTGFAIWTTDNRAYQYTLELSDIPSGNFTTVVDRTANAQTGDLSDTFPAATGRYAKLTVTGVDGDTTIWVSIYEVEFTFSTLTGYDQWASGWGTDIGAATNDHDGDGLSNFGEYALGGDPANAQARGSKAVFKKSGSGFIYVHPKRSDDGSITYTVETCTNLMTGMWTNSGSVAVGTNVTGGELDFVTNEVDTIENENFIRLKIQQ